MTFRVSRRDFLHVGFAGGIGLTLAEFLQMQQAQAEIKKYEGKEGTAKSLIFIYLPGGMCHQETFDPKPYAPIEYRGSMKSIATNVSGVRINETLLPSLQLSRESLELLQGELKDSPVREYMRSKLRIANLLILSVIQRRNALYKITNEIVDAQQPFFEHGQTYLMPLHKQEFAERVSMKISTVRMALALKFVQTAHGLFRMEYFFSEDP